MVVRIIIALICLLSMNVIAQDRLNLVNGKTLSCWIDSVGKTGVYCVWKKKESDKGRSTVYHRGEVYSITKRDGKEEIVFLQDTLTGNGYSFDGIRVYRQGCLDAREEVNTNIIKYLGFGLGLAFVGWETNWLQEGAGTINVVFPLAYTLSVGIWKPNPRNKDLDKDMVQNPAYLLAYQKVGQGRRIGAALKGSAAGIVVGLLASGIKILAEK